MAALLDEEQVRDQLAAAEELVYLGHEFPAVVTAGAAIEGMLRLHAREARSASAEDLLEDLWAAGEVADIERERLRQALAARDDLAHGFIPRDPAAARADRLHLALEIAVRLLESLPAVAGAERAADDQLP